MGLHCPGYIGDTTAQVAADFYPGYAQMFTAIGRERGFPPVTRAQYDAARGPGGALFIGDAETVAEKILDVSEARGGIARISLQMTNVRLSHTRMLLGIELLGTQVSPLVRAAPAVPA